jgi:mono/diheme cytochrome c family protein
MQLFLPLDRRRRAKMTLMSKSIAGLTVLALAAPALTHAAETSVGQREYESKCIMCHGATGKGDGWFSEYLKRRPPSLTQLQKNNGGVFPFDRVYQVIDGRQVVQVHGPREMPVWGGVYRVESDTVYDSYLGQYFADDGMVRARILALIEYISRLQE